MSPSLTSHSNQTYKVIFQPSGQSGNVPEGTTLLEAARHLGVGIEAICGGHETCNKCTVRVEEGKFPKHNIHSIASHLTPMSSREQRFQQKQNSPTDSRFSCSARVIGDILVTVPEESQAQKQVVLKAASGRTIETDPIIRLYYLELDPPEQGGAGDWERALAELEERFGLDKVEFDYAALKELSDTLRHSDGAITLTVWDDRLVTRVQAGYQEQPIGLAVDVGSTTLAGYLCDLRTGELLATASAMNPQVTYGDDIMSRISYANEHKSGRERLHRAIIRALNKLAEDAVEQAVLSIRDIVDMTIVGNSVMHHLILNLNPKPLGEAPFVPIVESPVDIRAADLRIKLHPGARLHILPLEAGFVGADNVAVILSEQPHCQEENMLIIDVGTNGELLLGNRDRLLCTSSPTGPALEGAQITHGMRAAQGAIERVRIEPGTLDVRFKVIGHDHWNNELAPDTVQARGICGSGIIEAVAEMFAAGILQKNGRFAKTLDSHRYIREENVDAFVLAEAEQTAGGSPIIVSQQDVRAIQLAKAALYVGAQLLMRELEIEHIDHIVLAGAFGSVIDPQYAMMLGMIPDCELERVHSAGNAAGDGARIALLNKKQRAEAARVARWVEHVDQPMEDDFQSFFMAALSLPHSSHPFPHIESILDARRRNKTT
ncbi:MAG: DUF4445 domain-containing protein [Chloroflexi bacterium]|nr:MAG: DUF4445 domain-containing protein [Chloroflexota bacterium]MBL1196714.1 DUF4445 domain-containing protein [Chloroflexota bacterium]NOH14007.1 DUF4445 domain-containing protein [Chloroflexota bacterium]